MNKAYLLIGGNRGDRKGFLARARAAIGQECGPIVEQSALYETAAWGLEEQDAFLNQALALETALGAESLLKKLLQVEAALGRVRDVKYGPRTIDIDILFYNDDVLQTEGLTLPHPQLQNRRFVLVPMAEIAPALRHPVVDKTISQLLDECPDHLAVQKFQG